MTGYSRCDSRFAAWELPQKPSKFCGLQRAADADSQIAGSVYPKLPTSMRPASRAASSPVGVTRSEEHTSELQSLMRISYAVFCLKKKKYYMKDSNMQSILTHIRLIHCDKHNKL